MFLVYNFKNGFLINPKYVEYLDNLKKNILNIKNIQ